MFKTAFFQIEEGRLFFFFFAMLQIGRFSPVFCRYLFNQSHMKKKNALHSNELAKGYTFNTLIAITIFIDMYLRSDVVKLGRFFANLWNLLICEK